MRPEKFQLDQRKCFAPDLVGYYAEFLSIIFARISGSDPKFRDDFLPGSFT
jgi:hypothetical protein